MPKICPVKNILFLPAGYQRIARLRIPRDSPGREYLKHYDGQVWGKIREESCVLEDIFINHHISHVTMSSSFRKNAWDHTK